MLHVCHDKVNTYYSFICMGLCVMIKEKQSVHLVIGDEAKCYVNWFA